MADILYAGNGKKIESIVRETVSGRNPKASGTISNLESLTEYYGFVDIGNPERSPARRVGGALISVGQCAVKIEILYCFEILCHHPERMC